MLHSFEITSNLWGLWVLALGQQVRRHIALSPREQERNVDGNPKAKGMF